MTERAAEVAAAEKDGSPDFPGKIKKRELLKSLDYQFTLSSR